MSPDLFLCSAWLLGLLGSLHCIGMCGPIALALPLNRRTRATAAGGLLLYHAGRASTYAALGAVSGLAGTAVQWAAGQQILSIVAGSIILLAVLAGLTGRRMPVPRFVQRFLSAGQNRLGVLLKNRRAGALAAIGMLNGLLPCGLVYAGLAGASATGSAGYGALFMAVFAAGTVPALFVLSWAGRKISLSFREKLRKAVPVFVAVMALLLILRGMGLGIPGLSPAFSHGRPACCCHHPH